MRLITVLWDPNESEKVVRIRLEDDSTRTELSLTLDEAMSMYAELRKLGVYVGQ